MREANGEPRPDARCRFDISMTAVGRNRLLGDEETEPQALAYVPTIVLPQHLVVPIQYVWKFAGRDALAVILDLDHRPVYRSIETDVDVRGSVRMLNGVRQQVHNHVGQPAG